MSSSAGRHSGQTAWTSAAGQREIAARCGVGTGKSVSEQLQRLSAALESDSRLGRQVKTLEKKLEQERDAAKH